MQPLRDSIYDKLQQRPYTLEELAYQYRTSTDVIQVQLHRLQTEGKPIKVTHEEVCLLLNHKLALWPFVWWFMLLAVFIFLGSVGE